MQYRRLTEQVFAKSDFFLHVFSFILILTITDLYLFFWLGPQGIHVARQADSFSFSFFYFLADSSLFSPGNLNLESINGKCAGEFPLLYYLTSKIYLLTGLSFIPLKLITIASLFVVFVFGSKTAMILSGSKTLSISLASLFISSTVLLYYSVAVLPDIHALAFCTISVYYFFLFNKTNSDSHIAPIFIFGAISALLKASFFMYVIAFCLLMIFSRFKQKKDLKRILFWFFGCSIVVFTWYIYANHYNHVNNDFYYTTKPKPFWRESTERIRLALDFISGYWYSKYYYQSTFHFIFAMYFVFLFVKRKDSNGLFLLFVLLCANVSYLLLFLTQFIHHDYYFIVIIPTILILTSIAAAELLRHISKRWFSFLFHSFIIVLTVLSLMYARLNLHRRYDGVVDNAIVPYQLKGASILLDSLNIAREKTFIVIGDPSQNVSLIFLERLGWTYKEFPVDSAQFLQRIRIADYLVILSPSKRRLPNYLRLVAGQHDFEFKNNFFYKLDD